MALMRKEVAVHLPRLKEHRERALLTQAELAAKSGVSEVTINRIENGRHDPRFSTVRKLAQALNVAPPELMEPGRDQESKRAA
jgi:transcriptional regulator with XRE-family HTH domain